VCGNAQSTHSSQPEGAALKPLLAVNIGVSAPLVVKSFAAALPGSKLGKTD
tara:strand:+ start:251 stop:403 length:153 start_codon:yes stop_codon:yes gene_type:complete